MAGLKASARPWRRKFRRRRKDVQVLGGAPPIGVEVQRISAADHERKTRFEKILQNARIELLRLGKRREPGRTGSCRVLRTQRSNLAISRVHRISPCSVHRTPIDADGGSSLESHREAQRERPRCAAKQVAETPAESPGITGTMMFGLRR